MSSLKTVDGVIGDVSSQKTVDFAARVVQSKDCRLFFLELLPHHEIETEIGKMSSQKTVDIAAIVVQSKDCRLYFIGLLASS